MNLLNTDSLSFHLSDPKGKGKDAAVISLSLEPHSRSSPAFFLWFLHRPANDAAPGRLWTFNIIYGPVGGSMGQELGVRAVGSGVNASGLNAQSLRLLKNK